MTASPVASHRSTASIESVPSVATTPETAVSTEVAESIHAREEYDSDFESDEEQTSRDMVQVPKQSTSTRATQTLSTTFGQHDEQLLEAILQKSLSLHFYDDGISLIYLSHIFVF